MPQIHTGEKVTLNKVRHMMVNGFQKLSPSSFPLNHGCRHPSAFYEVRDYFFGAADSHRYTAMGATARRGCLI